MVFTTLYTLAVCGVGFWWLSRNWTPTLQVAKNSLPPFEIKIDQGHLSTTLPEPFVFSVPEFAMIVDTSGKILSAEDVDAHEQALVITKTKAIIKKSRFESREYLWAAAPDFQVTTADVIDWLIAYKNRILWVLFTTLALGILPLLWLFLIPVIFFLALLLMAPAKLLATNLKYGQTVSIAFYAVTLPTLVQTVLVTQGLAGSGIFWLVYLAWAVVGVVVARGTQSPSADEPSAPPPPPAFKS